MPHPVPPSRPKSASNVTYGRFAAPNLNPNRPHSANPARKVFRLAIDPAALQRPQTAGSGRLGGTIGAGSLRARTGTPLTSARKAKLVQSLRRDKLVNALFLKLQFGGKTPELRELAKMAQGGGGRAPRQLVALVEAEAKKLMLQMDGKSPASSARTSQVPTNLRRCVSPRNSGRGTPDPASFAGSLGAAADRIAKLLRRLVCRKRQPEAALEIIKIVAESSGGEKVAMQLDMSDDLALRLTMYQQIFFVLDTDYGGSLDVDEISVFGEYTLGEDWSTDVASDFMETIDTNHDGVLVMAEFCKFCEEKIYKVALDVKVVLAPPCIFR